MVGSIAELRNHWKTELDKMYFLERGRPPAKKYAPKVGRMEVSYEKDTGTITVDLLPIGIDKMLICEGVFFEDIQAICIKGDCLTPDHWVGGKTIMEQVNEYVDEHLHEFKEIEP